MIAMLMVTANSLSSRPSMPPMKMTGMNTATSEIVIEMMVKPISRDPFSAACSTGFALFAMAHDVLEHDDRVVDDEADRQRQRHQRQIVEAEPQRYA